jgi:2,4-dienoyl-CoA reductase-like NADH-dependent reductase (Old Yellow Enzyme family)
VITDFKTATKRAAQAGYKVMMGDSALHQFLSPLSNVRTDVCTEGVLKIRLTLEVVEAFNKNSIKLTLVCANISYRLG